MGADTSHIRLATLASLLSSATIIASLLAMGWLLHDINAFTEEAGKELREFQSLADDAWSTMQADMPPISFSVAFRIREKRSPYGSSGSRGGGGEDCGCAARSHTCPEGAPGEPGAPGAPGENGEPGAPGKDGLTGMMVLVSTGPSECIRCPQGPPGFPGPPGCAGEPGRGGFPGMDGRPGRNGEPGRPGPPGTPGRPGDNGGDGHPGRRGENGMRGRGMPGITGPSGPLGAVGRPGDRGETGAQGEPGPQGEPGLPGNDGEQGPTGNEGPEGMLGRPGVDAGYCACPNRATPSLGVDADYVNEQGAQSEYGRKRARKALLHRRVVLLRKKLYN